MALLGKILIIFWFYLGIGYAVTIVSQVLAHAVEKMDDYYDWCTSVKLDMDADDFGLNLVYCIIFWPFLMIGCVLMLAEVWFKMLFRKILKVFNKKK